MRPDPTFKAELTPADLYGQAFWRLLSRCALIGCAVNIGFFFVFLSSGPVILAWMNALGGIAFTSAYFAIKNSYNRFALCLIWIDVLAHSALGVLMIGWGSGFQYYLLIFIPVICLSTPGKWVIPGLILLWAYYIGLAMMMRAVGPAGALPDSTLNLVLLFNMTAFFAVFSYLSVFYLNVVINAQRNLHRMAITDPLTGLLNRRHMTLFLDQEIERFKRSGPPACLILLDIDHFKAINDKYGHEAGDKALTIVAKVISGSSRSQDLVSRWGGEEFLILLPQSTENEALQVAERVRSAVESDPSLATLGLAGAITVSVGLTELKPGDEHATAIGRADSAMYLSKTEGRNRVNSA